MEKRLALAFVLTAVLLIVWQTFFPPVKPLPAHRADSTAVATPSVAAAPGLPGAPAAAAAAGQRVRVRSPLYQYDFSTRGAALLSAELLKFPSYVHRGERVQLIPRSASDVLSGVAVAAGRTLDLRGAEFTPSVASLDLKAGDAPRTLTFTA